MNLSKLGSCLVFLLLIFCLTIPSVAQSATVKGRVVNRKHQGIADINLGLQGTTMGAASAKNGNFKITNIPPGSYKFKASGVGFNTVSKSITLKTGQVLRLTIHLSQSTENLQSITVEGVMDNPFTEEKSTSPAKIPLKRLNNPQAYTTINSTLFEQQLAVSYMDIFKNISGSNVPSVNTHGRLDVASRGFESRSYTKDGVSGLTHTAIDPANIAKIQYIRGPSATLYGSQGSSYGGILNIITKKPYNSFGGNVAFTGGSFGLNLLTMDLNTPLNKQHTVLFRLNGAGERKNSFMDAGYKKSVFAAPDLIWKINDRLNFEIQGEYYNREGTGPLYFSPEKITDINHVKDLGFDFHKSFNPNEISTTGKQADLHATLNEKLSKNWSGRTDFVATSNHDGGTKLHFKGVTDSTLYPSVSASPERYSTIEAQQNFNNTIELGKIKNKFLLGLDFYHFNHRLQESKFKFNTINFIHPGSNYDELTEQAIDHKKRQAKRKDQTTLQNAYGAYGSNVITFNDRLTAMVSLRLDHFESRGTRDNETGDLSGKYGQTALSTKVGLVYQPLRDRVSIYGNYMSGFQNVNGTSYAGKTFSPQRGRQFEGGVKLSLFDHRLSSRLSYYNILVTKILRDDPVHQDYKLQNGRELSRGIELSATAHLLPGLNILVGYALNHFKYKNISRKLNGRRDPHSGPENTANFWASYQLMSGNFHGLGFGFGGNYGSQRSEVKHAPDRFYLPSYMVLDATIFYRHDFYQFDVKLNNLNNERYWTNRLALKEPRAILGRVTVHF